MERLFYLWLFFDTNYKKTIEMSKKNLLFVCVCLIGLLPLCGQNVTVVEQNESFAVSEKQKEFYYIEKEFPLMGVAC